MKHFNPRPVDLRKTCEGLEKFELGCARGRDQAGPALLLNGLSQDRGSLVGCDVGHLALVTEAFDHHGEILQNQDFAGARWLALCCAIFASVRHSSTEGNTSLIEGRGCSLSLSARMNAAASS